MGLGADVLGRGRPVLVSVFIATVAPVFGTSPARGASLGVAETAGPAPGLPGEAAPDAPWFWTEPVFIVGPEPASLLLSVFSSCAI